MPSTPAIERTSPGAGLASVQRTGSSLRLVTTDINAAGVSRFGSMLINNRPMRVRSAGARFFSIALPLSTISGQMYWHEV